MAKRKSRRKTPTMLLRDFIALYMDVYGTTDVAIDVPTGDVGELNTHKKLTAMGFHVKKMPAGFQAYDYIITDTRTGKVSTIQVKTNATQNFWLVKKMDETLVDWVVLVDLRQDINNPAFYILPTAVSNSLLSYDRTEKASSFLKYADAQPYLELWSQLWGPLPVLQK
jgi:hypothetical protein